MPKQLLATIDIPGGLPKCGSPNARCHWRQRHSQFKTARETAYFATVSHLVNHPLPPIPETTGLAISWRIGLPRGANRRDLDNVIGSAKPILDGIQDAIGMDDSRFAEVAVDQYRSQSGEWEVSATLYAIT